MQAGVSHSCTLAAATPRRTAPTGRAARCLRRDCTARPSGQTLPRRRRRRRQQGRRRRARTARWRTAPRDCRAAASRRRRPAALPPHRSCRKTARAAPNVRLGSSWQEEGWWDGATSRRAAQEEVWAGTSRGAHAPCPAWAFRIVRKTSSRPSDARRCYRIFEIFAIGAPGACDTSHFVAPRPLPSFESPLLHARLRDGAAAQQARQGPPAAPAGAGCRAAGMQSSPTRIVAGQQTATMRSPSVARTRRGSAQTADRRQTGAQQPRRQSYAGRRARARGEAPRGASRSGAAAARALEAAVPSRRCCPPHPGVWTRAGNRVQGTVRAFLRVDRPHRGQGTAVPASVLCPLESVCASKPQI